MLYCLLWVCACVSTQVSTIMDKVSVGGVRPALGLAWAEQVTVRLMMTRSEGVGHGQEEEELDKVPVCTYMSAYNFSSHYVSR